MPRLIGVGQTRRVSSVLDLALACDDDEHGYEEVQMILAIYMGVLFAAAVGRKTRGPLACAGAGIAAIAESPTPP